MENENNDANLNNSKDNGGNNTQQQKLIDLINK